MEDDIEVCGSGNTALCVECRLRKQVGGDGVGASLGGDALCNVGNGDIDSDDEDADDDEEEDEVEVVDELCNSLM